jgi:ATP-dependent Clp protease ATP-binding subunit ClpC
MFERFTERARQVVVLAQDEARALGHNFIGTEHLLLGLLREEEGLGARVLDSFGVTLEEVRAQVARIVGQGDEQQTGQIPFTPRAKKTLELALREAISLGHDSIGTEHILLGLVRGDKGVGVDILRGFGVASDDAHQRVIELLRGRGTFGPWEHALEELNEPAEDWPSRLERWRAEGWEIVRVTVQRRRRRA